MKVTPDHPQWGGYEFYIDGGIASDLDQIVQRVHKKDEDYFLLVDGLEGSGKSVLTMQLAKYVDPTFDLSRVCFSAEQFEKAIYNSKKGQAVVFDEAFRGFSARGALSEVNKILVTLTMEMRQKNLFVFLVLPTFFQMEKHLVLHRAKGLFHVYRRDRERGYWSFFNQSKMKLLYIMGKKFYSYQKPRSGVRGRFTDQYVIDEEEYRRLKDEGFRKGSKGSMADRYKKQLQTILWLGVKEWGITETAISDSLRNYGVHLTKGRISQVVNEADERLRKEGLIL